LPRHISHFSPRSLRHLMTLLGFHEVSLLTTPTTYVERSASYLYAKALERIGISPFPMSKVGRRSIPSRLVRKALRLSLIEPFGHLASAVGAGASIEAVFSKMTRASGSSRVSS
jgi:hypothetical protein